MLSHRFQDHLETVRYPWYIQPKLNGIRMLAFNGTLQSRSYGLVQERTWPQARLAHIRAALAAVPEHFMLDGELYVHGWSLQKINGVASINALADSEHTVLLQYHVFDIVNTRSLEEPFAERAEYLAAFRRRLEAPLCFVETILVPDQIRGDALYTAWKHFGYEGAVYKDPAESYGFAEHCGNKENRWKKTLKRKDYLDLVARCVGLIPGDDNKYEGMCASLVFQLDNGIRFQAGSGLSDFERQEFYDNPPLDRYFSLKYFALSDDGKPLQPSILSPL